MTGARLTHPTVPAALVSAGAFALAGAALTSTVAGLLGVVLVWTLLGVTAGYSISGSV